MGGLSWRLLPPSVELEEGRGFLGAGGDAKMRGFRVRTVSTRLDKGETTTGLTSGNGPCEPLGSLL